jgi:diacylglycerol kinase family enzyme
METGAALAPQTLTQTPRVSSMDRGTVVVNARSGSGDNHPVASRIAEIFAAQGAAPAIAVVAGSEVADATRSALEHGASVVVAAGGDGTVGTVASVLAGTRATLGVIPLGTLNHFAKDLQIPLDVEAAVRTIAEGHSVAVDLGDVNGQLFVNTASLGLYPRLVWEREKAQRGGRRKWRALAVAAVRMWYQYRSVHAVLRSDDHCRLVRTPFVFVGNNEYQLEPDKVGGRQRLDEGRLHVCIAPDMTRIAFVRLLVTAVMGRLQAAHSIESLFSTAVSIEVDGSKVGVSLDGELCIMAVPLSFRIRPGILRVIVPDAHPTAEPVNPGGRVA